MGILEHDLLHPNPSVEAKKHKLKRLVQSPNSYFMDVKCPGCYKLGSSAQQVLLKNLEAELDGKHTVVCVCLGLRLSSNDWLDLLINKRRAIVRQTMSAEEGGSPLGRLVLRRSVEDQLKFEDLSAEDRAMLRSCARDMGARAGIGFAASVSILSLFRVALPSGRLPRYAKYLLLPGFCVGCSYLGAMTGLPRAVDQIMRMENSTLAEYVTEEVENWNTGGIVKISEANRDRK